MATKITEKDCLNEIEDVCRSILYYKNDDDSLKIKWATIKCALEKLTEIRIIRQAVKEEKARKKAAEAYGVGRRRRTK